MNNNGTGLVLASMALADHPRVLLAIIFYNLVQHLVAGIVDANWPRLRKAAQSIANSRQSALSWELFRRFFRFSVVRQDPALLTEWLETWPAKRMNLVAVCTSA